MCIRDSVNVDSLKADIAAFKAHKFIEVDPPLETVIDMKFVDAANKTLGRR